MSPLQRKQLANQTPRLKLSLAEITARESGISIPYKSILQPPGWSENPEGRRIYTGLSSIARQFVTTNYDEWLDVTLPQMGGPSAGAANGGISIPPRERLYLPEHMDFARFRQSNCVVHLHGSVTDTRNMVLTTSDYIRLYASDRDRVGGRGENPVLSFLTLLFELRNVLFIGYGLEELEILEYVILKSRTRGDQPKEMKHFILQGFYSVEAELCKALSKYYSDWGIALIPFSLDDADWAQLTEVVDQIASEVPTAQEPALAMRADMQRLLHG
nr:SIR2 family protein [Luteimonas sp. MC1750]